jgi:hypothetical protein
MLPADVITHKPDSLAYPWSLFISSWQVCSILLQVTGICGADTCVWKPRGGLSEDFLYIADIEFI